jgi:hypothetical protein
MVPLEPADKAGFAGTLPVITLGTGIPKHETVKLSCQPWGDEWSREGYVLEKTDSPNEKKKSS